MAASANPSGNQEQQQQQKNDNNNINNCSNNNNNGKNGGNTGVLSGIKHNPGISSDWSCEEQSILDDGLLTYASELNVVRYAKIALTMPNKTVRDIAFRCRWLNKKEVSKRRKEDHTRKNKDKREKVTENTSKPPHLASRPSGHAYTVPTIPVDTEDGVPFEAIGGTTGELLKQNQQFFQQISTNFSYQMQDNVSLFCQARDNLAKIMNRNVKSSMTAYVTEIDSTLTAAMSDTPEIMKQMPPLPVKLNEDLANTILPRLSHQIQS